MISTNQFKNGTHIDVEGTIFKIVEFQQVYEQLDRESYRWDLWAAAYVINGGCSDDGVARFGKVVSKVPVHRLTDALDRLLNLYRGQRVGEEDLGAFFRRIPPAQATEALIAVPSPAAASDVIQVWMDVAAHPARGLEQSDLIRQRVLGPIISKGE